MAKSFGEIDLPIHRGVGDGGNLFGPTGRGAEQVDHFVLKKRRVGVHHHEVLRTPVQPGTLHRQIKPTRVGD